ncbi:MAG: thioesterase family protein [Woeseiaceae bacterium]|nr:thioesterase family protein [Woeseiaceae bacterium]
MAEAFFREHDGWLVGNDAARGPWSADACHAGPVTGALAGCAESVVESKQLVRLTANFTRPVPMAGFRLEPELLRDGRATAMVRVDLRDRDDRFCASAECLFVSEAPNDLPSATLPVPPFDNSSPGHFPVTETLHGERMFGHFVEIRFPEGQDGSPGPTSLWMRAPAIVDGEANSAFQTACPVADCGNGISRNSEFVNTSCVNADLTVSLFRLPRSDWILSDSISFWEQNGIGLSHSMLFDRDGPIGTALQSLVLRRIRE